MPPRSRSASTPWLLAAYFKLMNVWCHQDDMIINMPVFNREQYFAGARKTVGSFIDIFPVRLQTHFDEPIVQIARQGRGVHPQAP